MSDSSSPSKDFSSDAYAASLADEVEKLKVGDRIENDDQINVPNDDGDNTTITSSSSSSSSSHTTAQIEEIIEKDPAKALAAKVRGNEFFARQNYTAAIEEYTQAIELCPSGADASDENKEQLSIYFSNRAACHLMLAAYDATVADCTASLELQPNNPKPLGRRAKAYEKLDQLQEAVEDYKALVALDSTDRESAAALKRTETALNEKNEKMKAEMLGKLKDFGNTILGKFGMSLDNFKATQDPKTGSYNISFGK